MAKKLGSDTTAPKVGAKSPGAPAAGGNQVVTQESFLQAVKEIGAQRSIIKAEVDKLKAIRVQWKGAGIQLGILDKTVKMAEWTRGEIRDHFSVQGQYASWLAFPVSPQVKPVRVVGADDDAVQRREWFDLGRTYSRTGKPPRPPEECPDEFHQAFMAGFNEEDEAAWLDSDNAAPSAALDEPAPAPPAQPTLAEAAIEAMQADGEKAASTEPLVEPLVEAASTDFAQPSWKGYSDDPEDWFAAQWRDFEGWYGSIPDGVTVRITHKGVAKAFRDRNAQDAAQAASNAAAAEEDPENRKDAYGMGFAACKANEPREAPASMTRDDQDRWLTGWDVQANRELDKSPKAASPPPPAKPKASRSKAVH
jgi:hypothetical protein